MQIENIDISKLNPAKYKPRKDLKPGDIEYEKLKQADECIYTSKEYYDGCMLKRNRYMVDHAEFIISAWDGRKFGGPMQQLIMQKN